MGAASRGIALAVLLRWPRPRPRLPASETFKGTIVTSGVSGTRTVITNAVVTKGMVSGAGRIVEVPNLPTDLDTFSRDHLVFASDSIHIVSTNMDFSVSVNPSSCLPTVTIQPTGEFAGDIGQFAAATGRFGRLHGVRPAPGPAVVAELSRPPCRAHDVGETSRLVAGRNEHATPGKTLEAVRLVRRGRVASLSASTWPSPFLTRMHSPQLAQGVQVAIECDPNPAFDAGSPSRAAAGIAELVQRRLNTLAAPGPSSRA
jgi:hypothetical protein